MPVKLSVDELYKCCNQDIFKFKTTGDLPFFEKTIGQERALRGNKEKDDDEEKEKCKKENNT